MKFFESLQYEVENTPEVYYELSMEKGWGDGLPILPPTEDRVAAMVNASGRSPDESIGRIPHLFGDATIEKIAINAVMAGCLPEYMPVLVAATEAIIDPIYFLPSVQGTTNCIAQLIVVHGPARHTLRINYQENLFGQGWRANATIGRAFRLILQNIGGAKPRVTDYSTFGHQGKYSSCIGENEEASPWPPLHVERGFKNTDSAVTVIAIDPHIMVNDASSTSAEGVLHSIASGMIQAGSNNALFGGEPVVILGPEHVDILADDGWDPTKIKDYLFKNGRVPVSFFSTENLNRLRKNRSHLFENEDIDKIPIAENADNICLFVAGGLGKHSLIIPTFGSARSVTHKIDVLPQSKLEVK